MLREKTMSIKIVFTRFLKHEDGATAIEYGLIAALIGVGIVVGTTTFSTSLNGMFTNVDSKLVEAFDQPGSGGPTGPE